MSVNLIDKLAQTLKHIKSDLVRLQNDFERLQKTRPLVHTQRGEKGDKGDQGPPGKDAEPIAGPMGPQGPPGKDAPPVKPPRDGIDGRDGRDGESIVGPQGPMGPPGKTPKAIAGPSGKNGRDGKDGKNGKDGKSVEKLTVEDGVLFVWIDGIKKRVGKILSAKLLGALGGGGGGTVKIRQTLNTHVRQIAGLIADIGKARSMINKVTDERVRWKNQWVEGYYSKNDMVLDEGWSMIANKGTFDKAAPKDIGEPANALPDSPLFTTSGLPARIYSGQRYTFNEPGFLKYIRVWVPEVTATTTYRVVIVDQTVAGDPRTSILSDFNLTAGQWNIITFGSLLIPIGGVYTIYLDTINSGSETTITGGWIYTGETNNQTPLTGQWNQNLANDVLRINIVDLDTTSRQSELLSVVAGSEISMVQTNDNQQFTVFSVVGEPNLVNDYVEYAVVVADQQLGGPNNNETTTITASVPVPQTADYVTEVGYWPTSSIVAVDIQGFFAVDGVVDETKTDDAFGVDILFQKIFKSIDWDINSYSSDLAFAGATSGSGIQSTASTASTIEALPMQSTSNNFAIDPVTVIDESANLRRGNYLIYFNFEARSLAQNRSIVVALYINDELIDNPFSMEPKDDSNNPYPMKIIPYRVDESGFFNLKVKFGRSGVGSSVVEIENVRLVIVPNG